MERITEREKFEALAKTLYSIGKITKKDLKFFVDNEEILTCQSFSRGFLVIELLDEDSQIHNLRCFNWGLDDVELLGDIELPFISTFDECNELMTEITK